MTIHISSDALRDLEEGFWFYEQQASGLWGYFRSCLLADIESLAYYGGIHGLVHGFHRALSKRFPFCIYYTLDVDDLTVVAVLDARRDPLWTRQRLG
jgi:plasmid stabilization system protein ParE